MPDLRTRRGLFVWSNNSIFENQRRGLFIGRFNFKTSNWDAIETDFGPDAKSF
jgi:hypothetical protein